MPRYFYRARDFEGRAHEGIKSAASEDEVLRMLEATKLVPVLIETRSSEWGIAGGEELVRRWSGALSRLNGHVKRGSVALFARQLATMIGAGLPLVRSIRSIGRDHYDPNLTKILEKVADDVQRGESLSAALSNHPQAFDPVFVSLVKTGEVSGTLDRIMDQTASYLERAESLRQRVEAALRYPTFVLSFAGIVLLAMMLKIVPMFADIYARFGVALPLPTRILLGISQVFAHNALLLGALAAVVAVSVWRYTRAGRGRFLLDNAKLNVPLFGPLIRLYAISRFSRTLGVLVASGTHLLYSLKIMRPVPGNVVIEQAIEDARAKVEQGASLSGAMTETGVFPEMLVQVVATGEETGQLDSLLSRMADFYEQRVSAAVDGLSSLVEPIAIVLLGGMVGAMLVALYLPIFSLGQAMRSGLMTH
jgi:type IV pilus assembly protein PilC